MNRHRIAIAAGITAAAAVTVTMTTSALASGNGAEHAEATIVDTSGATVGIARLTEDGTGRVHLNVKVDGLTPGLHGIHVHGVGTCAGDFTGAGSHHNPLGAPHGAHAGDLPNLIVNANGRGHLDAAVTGFTLSDGPTTAFDANGSSIVIHAAEDDFVTQPTGNSGGRVACGVIVAG